MIPIDDSDIEPPESVTLSLILTNTYFVGTPDHATVTIQDNDDLSAPGTVTALNAPNGIDYHPANSSLIASVNNPTGNPKNFKRIASNGAQSDWSTASGFGSSEAELKVGIVQTTANGFNAGELHIGTGQTGKIGKISADGSTVTADWATLTNATQMVGETSLSLGGLYIDQTGVFGGDLIVVSGLGAVWRVTPSTNATRVAQINDPVNGVAATLEGVITVPNNPCAYGSWAGKILTCAESLNRIFTVDTNGTVTSFDFGMDHPEDADVVLGNQNLFCLNFNVGTPSASSMLKIPKTLLTNFAGDIVIVEEVFADLFIVHWDGVKFVTRRLAVPGANPLEHVSFAPIEAQ